MAHEKKSAPGFQPGDTVYYPTLGVGTLVSIEHTETSGLTVESYVIFIPREKLTLRVPTRKAIELGLKTIPGSDWEAQVKKSLDIITHKRKINQNMWSRKATEYENKISSGDMQAIAEVIRDLNRSHSDDTARSYSENVILDKAMERFVDLLAAVRQEEVAVTQQFINQHLEEHKKTELRF